MPLMKSALIVALPVLLTAATAAFAQSPAPAVGTGSGPPAVRAGVPTVKWAVDPDDEWQGLPDGAGREVVYYTCGVCHSLMWVRQQGLDKATWDETLDWMVAEQQMDPMDPKERTLAIDYLAEWFGPDRKALTRKK